MRYKTRKTVVFCAKKFVSVLSARPASPSRLAVRRLSRLAYNVAAFDIRHVPGYALHEKGLQRQTGVGTLVSSQERRAIAVSVINRG